MWAGIKGILGQQAGETDTGIAALRAQNGKMVSRSKGKRGVLVKHYRTLGTPTANETFESGCEKEINAWAEANVGASERERPWLRLVAERVHTRRSKESV